jgi:hypothetical protein
MNEREEAIPIVPPGVFRGVDPTVVDYLRDTLSYICTLSSVPAKKRLLWE